MGFRRGLSTAVAQDSPVTRAAARITRALRSRSGLQLGTEAATCTHALHNGPQLVLRERVEVDRSLRWQAATPRRLR